MLGKITEYQNVENSLKSPTSSNSSSQKTSSINDLSDDQDQKHVDENNLHFKLEHLLGIPEKLSFANVEIMIQDFLSDIKLYIDNKVKKK